MQLATGRVDTPEAGTVHKLPTEPAQHVMQVVVAIYASVTAWKSPYYKPSVKYGPAQGLLCESLYTPPHTAGSQQHSSSSLRNMLKLQRAEATAQGAVSVGADTP